MTFLKEFNLFELSKRINRPLILDGAMGSLLERKGLTSNDASWSAKINLSNPQEIFNIHIDYIKSGADIITTNTFRTNPYSLRQVGIHNYKIYVTEAINIAKSSVDSLPILIAGSNAPAEDCYQRIRKASKKELEMNHCNHIYTLFDNGCNFILNETQSHFDEIKIICEFCFKNNIPFVVSLYFDNDLKILSGEYVIDVIKFMQDYNLLSFSFNCISISTLNKLLYKLTPYQLSDQNYVSNFLWGFYLNIFSENIQSNYAHLIKDKLEFKPSFIGACCGSSPEDIKSIKGLLDGRDFS